MLGSDIMADKGKDKNLVVNANLDEKDEIVWYDADKPPFSIYGAYSTVPYKRIDLELAKAANDGVVFHHGNPSGVRARFRTNSPYIAVHAEWNEQEKYPSLTDIACCGFDLYTYNRGSRLQTYKGSLMPQPDSPKGFDHICYCDGVMTDYVLNFPLYNNLTNLLIGVKRGSEFEETEKYFNDLPVVFYGSSITQGCSASRPGNNYINILSRELNLDTVNLGFSGSARAEDSMVKYLSEQKMSAFVCDYDHNAPNVEHLEKTHYKIYDTVRTKHPDLPYIMLTKPDYKRDEGDDLRRVVVMKTFIKAIERGDKNVYFVDGASLFRGHRFMDCTIDGCHPNDLGFNYFAEALYPVLYRIFYK